MYGAGVTQEEAAEQPLTIAEILQSPGSNLGVTFNCLVFLDWKERGQFAFSNREWRTLSQNDSFGNWLCDRLHEECRLYVPPRPPPGLRWGTLFRDLWPLHRMPLLAWAGRTVAAEAAVAGVATLAVTLSLASQ